MNSTVAASRMPVNDSVRVGAAARLQLPAVLNSAQASALARDLGALRGNPLAIDAGSVRQIGALCVQVLVSARNSWAADGLAFSVSAVSESLLEQWALCGAPIAGFKRTKAS